MVWKGAIAAAVGFAIVFAVFVYERERTKREPKHVAEVAKPAPPPVPIKVEPIKPPVVQAQDDKPVKEDRPSKEEFVGPVEIESPTNVRYKNVYGLIRSKPRNAFYMLRIERENGISIDFMASASDEEIMEEFWIDVSADEALSDQIKTNHIGLKIDGFTIRDLTSEPGIKATENGKYSVTSLFPIEEIWRMSIFDRLQITAGQKTFNATKEEVEDVKDFARIVQKCISHRPGTPFPLE